MFRNFARRRCTTVWPSISHSLGLYCMFSSGVHMLLGKFTQDETAVVTRSLLRVSRQSMASKWTDRICYVSVWAGMCFGTRLTPNWFRQASSKPGRFPDMVGSCMPWFGVFLFRLKLSEKPSHGIQAPNADCRSLAHCPLGLLSQEVKPRCRQILRLPG